MVLQNIGGPFNPDKDDPKEYLKRLYEASQVSPPQPERPWTGRASGARSVLDQPRQEFERPPGVEPTGGMELEGLAPERGQMTPDAQMLLQEQEHKRKIAELAEKIPDTPILRALYLGLVGAGSDAVSLLGRVTGDEDAANAINKSANNLEEAAALTDAPGFSGTLSRGFRGAIRSLATMIPAGMAGGFPAIVAMATGSRVDDALSEADQAGLEGADKYEYAAKAGLIEGTITSAFQRMGLGGLEKQVLGRAVWNGIGDAVKRYGKNSLAELTEEEIISVLDSVNQVTKGIDPRYLSEVEWDKVIADTAVTTLMAQGMVHGAQNASAAAAYRRASKRNEGIVDRLTQQDNFFPGERIARTTKGRQLKLEEEGPADPLNAPATLRDEDDSLNQLRHADYEQQAQAGDVSGVIAANSPMNVARDLVESDPDLARYIVNMEPSRKNVGQFSPPGINWDQNQRKQFQRQVQYLLQQGGYSLEPPQDVSRKPQLEQVAQPTAIEPEPEQPDFTDVEEFANQIIDYNPGLAQTLAKKEPSKRVVEPVIAASGRRWNRAQREHFINYLKQRTAKKRPFAKKTMPAPQTSPKTQTMPAEQTSPKTQTMPAEQTSPEVITTKSGKPYKGLGIAKIWQSNYRKQGIDTELEEVDGGFVLRKTGKPVEPQKKVEAETKPQSEPKVEAEPKPKPKPKKQLLKKKDQRPAIEALDDKKKKQVETFVREFPDKEGELEEFFRNQPERMEYAKALYQLKQLDKTSGLAGTEAWLLKLLDHNSGNDITEDTVYNNLPEYYHDEMPGAFEDLADEGYIKRSKNKIALTNKGKNILAEYPRNELIKNVPKIETETEPQPQSKATTKESDAPKVEASVGKVLRAIGRKGEISLDELYDAVDVPPNKVENIIDELDDRDWINIHEDDSGNEIVILQDKGKTAYDALPKKKSPVKKKDRTSSPSDLRSSTGNVAPIVSSPALGQRTPKTKAGKKLLKKIRQEIPEGKPAEYGTRDITQFLVELTKSIFVQTKSQLRGAAAIYRPQGAAIFSRSDEWQINYHEIGHAIDFLLRETNGRIWDKTLSNNLKKFIAEDPQYASAISPEEGIAEIIRRFMVAPSTLPQDLTSKVLGKIKEIDPSLYDGLEDAQTAYQYFLSQPTDIRMKMVNPVYREFSDQSRAKHSLLRMQTFLFGDAPVRHHIKNHIYNLMTGKSKIERLDFTGATSVIKMSWNKSYKALIDYANESFKSLEDTKADFDSAFHFLLHIPQETSRVLSTTTGKDKRLRVLYTEGAWDLSAEERQELVDLGFTVPDVKNAKHGYWFYFDGKNYAEIKSEVGNLWTEFELYGQYRTALARGQDYPGLYGTLTPPEVQKQIDEYEKAHPEWKDLYKDVNQYMDNLLLIAYMSGEVSMDDLAKMKKRHQDYWPLQRQVGDRQSKSASRVSPRSGIHHALGSSRSFRTLDDAVTSRTKLTLSAYYESRAIDSLIEFGKVIDSDKNISLDARLAAKKMIIPLNPDTKQIKIHEEEKNEMLAKAINEMKALEQNITMDELKQTPDWVQPDEIKTITPGAEIFRTTDPRIHNVIRRWNKGKPVYYYVPDPIIFNMIAQSKSPVDYWRETADVITKVQRPWKHAKTENLLFAIRNVFWRDPVLAMQMGKNLGFKTWKNIIPGAYAAQGALNRLTGKYPDAISDFNAQARAIEATNTEAHKGLVASFKEQMTRGLDVPWSELDNWQRLRELPGMASALTFKGIDFINFVTAGKWLSNWGESVTREGAYIEAIKQGRSQEAAEYARDMITGNFAASSNAPNFRAFLRTAGFLNPSLQIMWGLYDQLYHPNPRMRVVNTMMKWPYFVKLGALGATVNYLLTLALYQDEEERDKVLQNLRERKDDDRAKFMAIGGTFRFPFNDGFVGGIMSYAWNRTEGYLLDDHIDTAKLVQSLLDNMRDIPTPTDAINPQAKTLFELAINYSFFWNEHIVPQWMEGRYPYNPELQSYATTPEIYKKIGGMAKVSPLKVRYAVRNLFDTEADKIFSAISRGIQDPSQLPVIGRLIVQEPKGWRSKSVNSLASMDDQYQYYKNRLKNEDDPKMRRKLTTKMVSLSLAHDVMMDVEKSWDKAKEARSNGNIKEMERWERQMRTTARAYLRWKDGQTMSKPIVDAVTDEFWGNQLYNLTNDPNKNIKGRTEQINRAKEAVRLMNLKPDDAIQIFRKEWNRRIGKPEGYIPKQWNTSRTRLTQYGKRLARLRQSLSRGGNTQG